MDDRGSIESYGVLPWIVAILLVVGMMVFAFVALPPSVLEWAGL
jgi:hypothetical protein